MAQYDGSIRVNTEINTKNASAQLTTLENRIKKTADKVASLRSKMDALKDAKIPTQEYTAAQKEVDRYSDALQRAKEKIDKLLELGVDKKGGRFISAQYDVAQLENKLLDAEDVVKRLESEGKAFTLGRDTEEFAKLGQQLQYAKNVLSVLSQRHDELIAKQGSVSSGYKKLGNVAKSVFSKLTKSTQKSNGLMSTMASRFKGLALSLLIFNQIGKAFNSMISGIKEGFSNLAGENVLFQNQVNSLKASLLTLKNTLAGAFAPIVQIAIPYIQQFIGWITSAVEAVGQFIAALTGRKTYIKAVQQTAGAFEEAAEAANDAKEAAEGYLSPLDEINKYSDGKDEGAGAGGAGGGAGGAGQMFEEVPVDSTISDMAENFKKVMSQLFTPFKEAWNREGKFVMDSWKFALQETWDLMKDIGRDFLEIWNEEATIQMFSDILHIIGDIGLVVGNLAESFSEAWNANDVGLQILGNIRDILAIIIDYIRSAADYTVEWSEKLDFYPLLQSINGLLEALKPLTDNIGAGLEWFYKNVLLPIAGWTIEDVIPAFLDLLSAALSSLNEIIAALQPLAVWLWDSFLQPLGQWAGDAIISAMQTITELLIKFGDWISEHQEAVQNFAVIVGSFAAAWGIVTAAVTAWNIVAGIASGITTALGAAIAFLTSPIGIAIAAIGAIIAIGVLLYKNWDEISVKAKEVWDFVKKKFQEFDTWLQNVFTHDWTEEFGVIGDVFNAFFKNVSNIWNSIKKIFNGIITFVKGVFTGNWRMAWEGVKQIFSGIWDGLVSVVKSPINAIISILNGLISGMASAVNGIADMLNSMRIDIPSWVPGIGGGTLGFNLPHWTPGKIPYLATGTVVPPNREFMAVLGDNKREPEVVSPLSTMKQAVKEAMAEMGSSGNKETIVIKQYLDGKQVYETVISNGKIQQMSTGRNPFMLGTI